MQFIAFITIKVFLLCSLIVKKTPKHKESKIKTDYSYDKCRDSYGVSCSSCCSLQVKQKLPIEIALHKSMQHYNYFKFS